MPDLPGMRIEIGQMTPGEVQFHQWQGRPILIYRREPVQITALQQQDERLRDPSSQRSRQPDAFTDSFRSASPEWFVAIAVGTGHGCLVELQAASDELFQSRTWAGGFKDTCGEDRYDLAGRVYSGQYADKNLAVPDYRIEGNTLVLGG